MKVTDFKVGDQVVLLSGGPTMTVKGFRERLDDRADPDSVVGRDSKLVKCQWFAGKKLEEGAFPAESLRVPEASKKSSAAT